MKMKPLPILVAALLCLGGVLYFTIQDRDDDTLLSEHFDLDEDGELSKELRIKEPLEWHFERTKDPRLGYPPLERLVEARRQTYERQLELLDVRGDVTAPRWRERGPFNIGGRTRALLIDRRDASGNTVFAGGVNGGIFKTDDISAEPPVWNNINDYLENLSIGFLAQDPTDLDVMYAGTGEGTAGFTMTRGAGIFKSTDGGENWTLLPSTSGSDFSTCQHLVVDPRNGDVYAAMSGGLFRSQNKGTTWTKVLASGSLGASNSFMFDLQYIDGFLYASNLRDIYKSATGGPNEWESITTNASNFPASWSRLEFSIAPTDPSRIYAIGNQGGGASNVYRTDNGGENWIKLGFPGVGGQEFTNGQVWYDLDIAVDPFNSSNVIIGGVPLMFSVDGAATFQLYDFSFHVDQHNILFDEEHQGIVLFGNDGGVYRTTNSSPNGGQDKNNGYNVTQYYSISMRPEPFGDYFLGGTQDNGSHLLNDPLVARASYVQGGDGMLNHIDQDNGDIQMVSFQFGVYSATTDGTNFSTGVDVNGGFVNESDYDNDADILYAETRDGDLYRYPIGAVGGVVDVEGFELSPSAIHADPNVDNRLYLGTGAGEILRIDNAHEGDVLTATELADFQGYVSNIYTEIGNPNHIVVTMGNYGLANNIYQSLDGGASWTGAEGTGLPDMPVLDLVLNPRNPQEAMIATELGVWTTDNLDGNNTVWYPPALEIGIPVVRTDDLDVRLSDNLVLAGTHGRGMFTTTVWADPLARPVAETVHYTDSPLQFLGSTSYNADDFAWDFGDGTTSTDADPTHSFDNIGTYPVELSINDGALSEGLEVKILPDRPLPYDEESADWGGDFEGQTEQYGVYTQRGSAWERGQSTFPGKIGSFSGNNAFTVGIDEQYVQPNTFTALYLPNYDFSEEGIYEISFMGKWRMHPGLDGMQVQYSTDRGRTWRQLGTKSPTWYGYTMNGLQGAPYPDGASYFTRDQLQWERFRTNISDLAGEENVAIRFVFRSDATGNYPGVAIDDVQISRFTGELETKINVIDAAYTQPDRITVTWSTRPEYFAQTFVLERSTDGRTWEEVATIQAEGGTTIEPQNYSEDFLAQRPVYFVRVRSLNANAPTDYEYEFLSPTLVVRRNADEPVEVIRVSPNPFTGPINVTVNDLLTGTLRATLVDAVGRVVGIDERDTDGTTPFFELDFDQHLPTGIYFLTIEMGEEDPQTFRLMRAAR